MNKIFLKLSTLLLFLTFSLAVNAQTQNAYAVISANGTTIEGQPQTTSIGGVDVSVMIEVLSVDHNITRPIDPASGIPSRIIHGEIRFVKRVNKASPLLAQAMDQGQLINATINYFRPTTAGQSELFYTMQLTNGLVTGIAPWKTSSTIGGASALGELFESFTLSYQNLTVTDTSSGTSYQY